jgi:hypothetical protein
VQSTFPPCPPAAFTSLGSAAGPCQRRTPSSTVRPAPSHAHPGGPHGPAEQSVGFFLSHFCRLGYAHASGGGWVESFADKNVRTPAAIISPAARARSALAPHAPFSSTENDVQSELLKTITEMLAPFDGGCAATGETLQRIRGPMATATETDGRAGHSGWKRRPVVRRHRRRPLSRRGAAGRRGAARDSRPFFCCTGSGEERFGTTTFGGRP